MNRFLITLLLLSTGASAAPEPVKLPEKNLIQVERDPDRGVTCYILNHVGISCVPDSQLKPEPSARQTQAPERRVDERYSM